MGELAIIGGDIHRLVSLKEDDDWSMYAWRIREDKNKFWVPIPDARKRNDGFWVFQFYETEECPTCLRRWYSKTVNKRM